MRNHSTLLSSSRGGRIASFPGQREYLASVTRLDISVAMSKLSQFVSNLGDGPYVLLRE